MQGQKKAMKNKSSKKAASEPERQSGKIGAGNPRIKEIAKMGRERYYHDEVADRINALPEADRRKAVEDFMHEAIIIGNIDSVDAD